MPRSAAGRHFLNVLGKFSLEIFGPSGPLGENFPTLCANFYHDFLVPQSRSSSKIFKRRRFAPLRPPSATKRFQKAELRAAQATFGSQKFSKGGVSRHSCRIRQPIIFKRRRCAPLMPPSAAKTFQKAALRVTHAAFGGQNFSKDGASRRKTLRAPRAIKKNP